MGEKNEIIKHEAQNLDIKFPHNSKLTEKENLLDVYKRQDHGGTGAGFPNPALQE